jgi:hypothetical protein
MLVVVSDQRCDVHTPTSCRGCAIFKKKTSPAALATIRGQPNYSGCSLVIIPLGKSSEGYCPLVAGVRKPFPSQTPPPHKSHFIITNVVFTCDGIHQPFR